MQTLDETVQIVEEVAIVMTKPRFFSEIFDNGNVTLTPVIKSKEIRCLYRKLRV